MSEGNSAPLFQQLIERILTREDLEVEFKLAKGGLPKEVWPTVSAFANTSGGWILLGLADGDPPQVEGVAKPHARIKEFYDLLYNEQKISSPVCGPNDATCEYVGDKPIVVIRIPAAARSSKPVFINNHPFGGTYVRRGEGDYACSRDEVLRLMREASVSAADSTVLPHLGMDDLDRDSVRSYRRRYQTLHPTEVRNSHDDLAFLTSISAYAKDRERDLEGLTVAGLLALGKSESILWWRKRHLIDYRRIATEADLDKRWDDRIAWDGNLLGAFDQIYPRLIQDQPIPFQLRDGMRMDQGPAHIALREALVNLLIHADYTETRASLIVRSPDGYEFKNPGNSRVPEAELQIGNHSDPRNPILTRMFRYIGIAEEAGTGIPKIIQAWRNLGLRMAAIDVGTEKYEFRLLLRHAHLLADDDRQWLTSIGDDWSESEQLALVVARHEGAVDKDTLCAMTGLHPADCTKVLSRLRSRGHLNLMGWGRRARYELGPAATGIPRLRLITALEAADGHEDADLSQAPPELTHSGAELPHLTPELTHSGAELPHLTPELTHSGTSRSASGSKPGPSPDTVGLIDRVAGSKHLPREAVERAILACCTERFVRPKELAAALNRSVVVISTYYLNPMLARELLEQRFPASRHHPEQAYRTRRGEDE